MFVDFLRASTSNCIVGAEDIMAKKVKRVAKGRRYQKAHKDGAIKTLIRNILKTFDLPEGSVQIVKPDRRRMRGDAKVSRLREAWSK
jgi:hypothetical protein